ncbi:MAG TPA: hypothetical protein VI589_09145, partial [Vicinamibacteria bacterium]
MSSNPWLLLRGVLGLGLFALPLPSLAGGATTLPTPPLEAFSVGGELPTGPRITPYLRLQLDRAWA